MSTECVHWSSSRHEQLPCCHHPQVHSSWTNGPPGPDSGDGFITDLAGTILDRALVLHHGPCEAEKCMCAISFYHFCKSISFSSQSSGALACERIDYDQPFAMFYPRRRRMKGTASHACPPSMFPGLSPINSCHWMA